MGLHITGDFVVDYGATLGAFGGAVSAAGGTNDGMLSLSGGSLSCSQPVVNNGHLDALRASLSSPGDGLANEIGVTNGGTLTLIDASVYQDVLAPAGSTLITAGQVDFHGWVSTNDVFTGGGAIVFHGGLSTADIATRVRFAGNVTIGASNTLALSPAGAATGDHDQFQIAGTALLSGLVEVQPLEGLLPNADQTFTSLAIGLTFYSLNAYRDSALALRLPAFEKLPTFPHTFDWTSGTLQLTSIKDQAPAVAPLAQLLPDAWKQADHANPPPVNYPTAVHGTDALREPDQ